MTQINKLHDHLYVAGQLFANDFTELAEQGVRTIINNRPDDEEPGQLNQADAARLAAEHGIEYHYLPMANGQPLAEGLVEEFKAVVDASNQPVLAHCRSGMRSSFIWALGEISAGNLSTDQAIDAAQSAGIPLQNARHVLDSVEMASKK